MTDYTLTGAVKVDPLITYIGQHHVSVNRGGKGYRVYDCFARKKEFYTLWGLNRYFKKQGWNDVWFVA